MSTLPSSPRIATPLMRDTLRFGVLAAVLGAMLGLAPLGFVDVQGAQVSHLRVGAKSYGGTQRLEVSLNKSVIVDLPADVTEVIVSQPGVAGAIMRSKRRAIIQGVAAGGTNIFFLDAGGEAIAVLDVAVGDSADNLVATLARVIPGSRIEVQTFGDGGVVLSGTVLSGDDLQKAITIAAQFTGGDPTRVANAITISGSQQVMLKVVVAEVRRDTLKDLGINLNGSLSIGPVNLGLNTTRATQTESITAGFATGGFSIDATLRALTQRDALRLLAEPTLTAMSGEPAELLVGGELPITVQDSSGRATTEWKPFGVELEVTPTVKSNGIIAVDVNTSVSELRSDGALNKRAVGTKVELPGGQTLALGGIYQDNTRQQIAGMPGLGDIPILGARVRSRQFRRSATELGVLVTPYLAYPGDRPAVPTDYVGVASDAEAIFLGRMERLYGVGPDGMRGSYSGSVGFVLD